MNQESGRLIIENKEKYTSRISLHFLRHSMKDNNSGNGDDSDIRLSSSGKKLALEKSSKDVDLNQAVAFGSPRIRTQETASIIMAGSREDITGDETFEELKAKLNKNKKYGTKISSDSRLDFNEDIKSPVGKALYEAYDKGEYVKFMIEKTDELTKETKDTTNSYYSYKAGQFAEIIEKYIKIAPKWDKLVLNDGEKRYTPTLERYLGTHQGPGECFLAKIIEKIDGIQARDIFVEAINKQGFDYLEGFNVDIETNNNYNTTVKVKFEKKLEDNSNYTFEHIIPLSLIQEIIKEGK